LTPLTNPALFASASHLQRRLDGARSASPRARAALTNRPMAIWRV